MVISACILIRAFFISKIPYIYSDKLYLIKKLTKMQNAKIKRTLTAQEKKSLFQSPAFPPQLFKDNFERIMAPVPGMNKIEFTAALILPFYLQQARRTKLWHNGAEISPVQAAVITARDLMEEAIEEIFDEATIITNE